MNLTAVVDVVPQRSTTPLDRPVSDSSEPAFASVMSRVRESGDEKSADPGTPMQNTAETQNERSVQNGSDAPRATAAAQPPAQNTESDVDSDAASNAAQADVDGQPLPVVAAPTGQTLPPLSEIVSDAGDAPAVDPSHPKPEDGAVDGDPSAVLLFAALGTPPPPPPQPTANVTSPAPPSGALEQSAASLSRPNDGSTAAAQSISDPAQLQTELDRSGKSVDQRAPNAATSQPAVAQAVAQAAAAQRSEQTPAAGSIAQTLRSFVRPQQLGTDTPNTTGARGNPRIRSVDASNRSSVSNAPVAQLATLIEGAAQKDPTATHQHSADASIRTDAVTQRTNGTPEAPRDPAAARLNDLAQLHAQRFAGELADRVLVLRSQRLDTATVTLEPRDLGRIDIHVRLQADTTHVAFTAQHAAVRDALEGQMPRLRAMLEDAGLSLGAMDVSHSGGQTGADAGAARSYEPPKASPSVSVGERVDGPTRWQRRAEDALIDLHA